MKPETVTEENVVLEAEAPKVEAATAPEVEAAAAARRPHHALEAPALRARRARVPRAEPGALVERRGRRDVLAADRSPVIR